MMKLPAGLSDAERSYLQTLDVAALDPSDPPYWLKTIATRYIKWGMHTPNVHTGLLGITPGKNGGFDVFIRCLLLNVQWTIVKQTYRTRDEALAVWFSQAQAMACPARIIDKQRHLVGVVECSEAA